MNPEYVTNARGEEVVKVSDVSALAKYYGVECHNPELGVFDISLTRREIRPRLYGMYSIVFINYTTPDWTYGKSRQKVLCGSVLTLSPGQFLLPSPSSVSHHVWTGIYFTASIIHGTHLGSVIHKYPFMEYMFNNNIFLNDMERSIFMKATKALREETEKKGENINVVYVSMILEGLLDMLQNAYERCSENYREQTDDMFANFEHNLNKYLYNGESHGNLPQVSHFAKMSKLSMRHFGESFKDLTTITAHSYILNKMRDASRQWLTEENEAREVSTRLGFSTPPHFTRFFSLLTGERPSDYRRKRKKTLSHDMEEFSNDKELQDNLEQVFTPDAPKSAIL